MLTATRFRRRPAPATAATTSRAVLLTTGRMFGPTSLRWSFLGYVCRGWGLLPISPRSEIGCRLTDATIQQCGLIATLPRHAPAVKPPRLLSGGVIWSLIPSYPHAIG